jgi:hypothetical protein
MNVGIPVHWQRIRLGDSALNKRLQEGKEGSVPQGSMALRPPVLLLYTSANSIHRRTGAFVPEKEQCLREPEVVPFAGAVRTLGTNHIWPPGDR